MTSPRWYNHYCDTLKDNRKMKLLRQYHGDGAMVLYCFQEEMMTSENGGLNEDDIERLAHLFPFQDPERVPEIVMKCIELKIFYKHKDGYIASELIDQQRGLLEESIERAKRGGQKSAEKKASEYKFVCTDGTYTLSKRTLEQWRGQYKNTDEIVEEYRGLCLKDENNRSPKKRIKELIESYLIQNAEDVRPSRKDNIPF